MVNTTAIQEAVAQILKAIGEDPHREGLADTPRRIADMYQEIFVGMNLDAAEELAVGFEEGHREMVILKDIPFYSMCERHFLPFFGRYDDHGPVSFGERSPARPRMGNRTTLLLEP